MKSLLLTIWNLFLETVFPAICCGCRREGGLLCDDCLNAVQLRDTALPEVVDSDCLDGVLACSEYHEGQMMAKLIYALKYDFVVDLALPLGQFLIDGYTNAEIAADVICPVPLHAKRFRWRGFNQAELLANVVAQEFGLPVRNFLERIHFKKAQMELRKEERKANVEKAFRMREDVDVAGKTVVLVDDVATTLSTLEACASVLKKAGAQKVYGIVLARVY